MKYLSIIFLITIAMSCTLHSVKTKTSKPTVEDSIVYTFYDLDSDIDSVIESRGRDENYFIRILQSRNSTDLLIDLYVQDSQVEEDPYLNTMLKKTNRFWIDSKGILIPVVFSFEKRTAEQGKRRTLILVHPIAGFRYSP